MSLHVGETFGDYRVLSILGAGAMGQVFLVEHRITQRKEAAKILSTDAPTETQIQRFERELAVHSRLSHPNIAAVHNAVRYESGLILIMEYVEGETLENLLKRGSLSMDAALEYIRQTLSALEYAHQQGVVHRDVNPSNLIVTPAGFVKLTDFSVAKAFGDLQLTNFGDLVGSVPYLAPEQAKGGVAPDPRSDLFAVGAILYEILTGRKPFGDNRLEALLTDSEQPPEPPANLVPELPPQWNEIVLRALEKDPAQRYPSAQKFLDALGTVKDIDVSAVAVPQTSAERNLSISARMGWAIACAAPLIVVAGLALIQFRALSAPAEKFHIVPPAGAWAKTPVNSAGVARPERQVPPHRVLRAKRGRISGKARATQLGAAKDASAPVGASGRAETVQTPAKALVPAGAEKSLEPETAQPPAESNTVQDPAPVATEPSAVLPGQSDRAEAGAAQAQETEAQQPQTARKKRFWQKLNPFKRRKAGGEERVE